LTFDLIYRIIVDNGDYMFLGIETSCDETSIAVIDENYKILSNIVSSQDEIHKEFGGVFPELAARAHIEKILPVFNEAIKQAGITKRDLKAIGVTSGPGLIGSLLVGLSFGKALSYSLSVPFFGINHLEAHLCLPLLTKNEIPFPGIGLLVSGGHTELVFLERWGKGESIARTLDDAAGEAFDKVARLLELGWPGGPAIERIAVTGDAKAIKFSIPKIKSGDLNFSFSGLKTAVYYQLKECPRKEDIAASFQEAVVSHLLINTLKAISMTGAKSIIAGGGVVANNRLREELTLLAKEKGLTLFLPEKNLCTDNGAMVCANLLFKIKEGSLPSSFDLAPFSR
jgi:N6-L-threonylcarbamoyladenine synthase